MKWLFDQNLPPRLSKTLEDIFPNSIHVGEIGFVEATDTEIWNYAKANNFTIISKDTDFQQRSLLLGHPPKVVWLRVGNYPAKTVIDLLRKHSISIHTFSLDENKSYLALP